MAYETIRLERRGFIATIILSRPAKRNAISSEMAGDVIAALNELAAPPTRVVILTGEGKSFCAGMDIEGLAKMYDQPIEEHVRDSQRLFKLFRGAHAFPKPLISAVNGAAVGGGCGLALAADFVLSTPDARFGYGEIKIGFVPAIVLVFLRRMLPDKQARDLLLTGRLIDGSEAHRLGLVTEVVPAEKLLARANDLADELAALSPSSMMSTKKLLFDVGSAGLDAELELAAKTNAFSRTTEDFREGITAFLEKRPPRWTGR